MIRFIAYTLTPLAIMLAVVLTLFSATTAYPRFNGNPLAIRAAVVPGPAAATPAEALDRLQDAPTRYRVPAGRDTVWFLVEVPASRDRESVPILNLPNPYVTALSCWNAADLQRPLLTFSDGEASGAMRRNLMGVLAYVDSVDRPGRLLCSTRLAVADGVSVTEWSHHAVSWLGVRQARATGLLEGGLLTLALFMAAVAFVAREWLYLLTAAWLVGTLRLGAWAMGLDTQWIGHIIPPESLPMLRKLTVAAYYILTYGLFNRIFGEKLSSVANERMRRVGRGSSLALLAAAFILPYEWFQPATFLAVWVATGMITVTLIYAFFHTSSRSWLLHLVGLSTALGAMLLGLVYVALDPDNRIDSLAGTVVLIVASIMVALTVSAHMRETRRSAFRARNELIVADTLMPFGLFVLNPNQHFEHLNETARQTLGLPDEQDHRALVWTDLFPAQDWTKVARHTAQGLETEIQMLERVTRPGPNRSFLLRATLDAGHIEGSLQDVSARTETIRKLRMMAENDPLTDALNRRGIEAAAERCIAELAQIGTPCAIGFLSLDHLKHINDTFGHTAGDELLQMVCERLKYSLNGAQQIGRVGSDEFVIVFPGLHATEARPTAEDIIESLNGSALYIGQRAFQIKSAMGLIDVHQDMSAKDAISAASRACRDARKHHTDIVLYEQGAAELFDHIEELRLFDQLEEGATPRDLFLEMQPIVSLRNPLGTLNFEVLLRAHSSGTTLINTGKIIQAAEDNGMISAIDKWVFSATLEWMSRHHTRLALTQQVNVNLSGVSLNDDKFIDVLFGVLGRYPQFTRRLCIEITEGVALQDLERTRQLMRRLQRMGAKVALDDFGAGYTSFSYLKELPADIIKIDGILVRDMLKTDANIAIVGSIVELAHNLGMECIAEWVEDLATLEALARMGVDQVQGHVFSAARPPSEILASDTVLPLIQDAGARQFLARQVGGTNAHP